MILIGTDEGIYRWTEGNNWPVFHSLQGRKIVGLASAGGGTLAALDKSGKVFETSNNGQDWRNLPTPDGSGAISTIAVGGTNPSILLTSVNLGFYRRNLGQLPPTIPTLERMMTAAPVLLNRAKSLVGGKSKGGTATASAPSKKSNSLNGWVKLFAPKVNGSPAITSLVASTTAWFMNVAGQGLFRSVDQGATWARVESLPTLVTTLREVPGKPGSLVAATSDGVKASNDGGVTWADSSPGLDGVKYVSAIEICPDEPSYILAGAAPSSPTSPTLAPTEGYGLFESKDSGKTWARVLRSFPEKMHADAIVDIRFDPAAPSHAVAAFASGEMHMTLTGGDYWQPFARAIGPVRVLCPIA
jgi:photosystem II stability/assembly factor-like uncharacterized protein